MSESHNRKKEGSHRKKDRSKMSEFQGNRVLTSHIEDSALCTCNHKKSQHWENKGCMNWDRYREGSGFCNCEGFTLDNSKIKQT